MTTEANKFDTQFSASVLALLGYLNMHVKESVQPLLDVLQNQGKYYTAEQLQLCFDKLKHMVIGDKEQISVRFATLFEYVRAENRELYAYVAAEYRKLELAQQDLKILYYAHNNQTVRLTKLFQSAAFVNFVHQEKKRYTQRSSLYCSDLFDSELSEQIFSIYEYNLRVKEVKPKDEIVFVVEISCYTEPDLYEQAMMTDDYNYGYTAQNSVEERADAVTAGSNVSSSYREIARLRKIIYSLIQRYIPGIAENNTEQVNDDFVVVMDSIYDRLGLAQRVERYRATGEFDGTEQDSVFARLAHLQRDSQPSSQRDRDYPQSTALNTQKAKRTGNYREFLLARPETDELEAHNHQALRNSSGLTIRDSLFARERSEKRFQTTLTFVVGTQTDPPQCCTNNNAASDAILNASATYQIALQQYQETPLETDRKPEPRNSRCRKASKKSIYTKPMRINETSDQQSCQQQKRPAYYTESKLTPAKQAEIVQSKRPTLDSEAKLSTPCENAERAGKLAYKSPYRIVETYAVEYAQSKILAPKNAVYAQSEPKRPFPSLEYVNTYHSNSEFEPPASYLAVANDSKIVATESTLAPTQMADTLQGSYIKSRQLFVDYKNGIMSVLDTYPANMSNHYASTSKINIAVKAYELPSPVIQDCTQNTLIYTRNIAFHHRNNCTQTAAITASGAAYVQTEPFDVVDSAPAYESCQPSPKLNQEIPYYSVRNCTVSFVFANKDEYTQASLCQCQELNYVRIRLNCVEKENQLLIGMLRTVEKDIMDEKQRMLARTRITQFLRYGKLQSETVLIADEQQLLISKEDDHARRYAMLYFASRYRNK